MSFRVVSVLLLVSAVTLALPTSQPSINGTKFERISEGKSARFGEFPYQVTLRVLTYAGLEYHGCSGAILNEYWILTAAHCVYHHSRLNPRTIMVVAGVIDLDRLDQGQRRSVQRTIPHPEFSNQAPYPNDIGLIKLTERLLWNDNVERIPIPTPMRKLSEYATASGWGVTGYEEGYPVSSSKLLKAQMPIQTPNNCERIVNSLRVMYYPSQICAGSVRGGGQACRGDSGGPLTQETSRGTTIVVGIVSWSKGVCGERIPTFFTNVAYYTDWIKGIVPMYPINHKRSF